MTTYTVTVFGHNEDTTIRLELTGSGATAVAKVARAITAEASAQGGGTAMFIATGIHDYANETEADL